MNVKNDNLNRLIQEIARLPGLGEKSAERLAMHIFKMSEPERNNFIQSIIAVKNVRHCQRCFNFITSPDATVGTPLTLRNNGNLCDICSDTRRDQNVICAVETHDDFRGIEKTGFYNGVYHILLGRIAPLEDCGPDKLTIAQLLDRIRQNTNISELILATNPTMEGDNTALYIKQEIAKILAQGPEIIPSEILPSDTECPQDTKCRASGTPLPEIIGTSFTLRTLRPDAKFIPPLAGVGTPLTLRPDATVGTPLTLRRQIKITRLARGIPSGSAIGYSNKTTLTESLSGRQEY